MRADVRRWLNDRTYSGTRWQPEQLLRAKREQGTTVSVVLPALDEEATVGDIVGALRVSLVERYPLIDELVVMDSGWTNPESSGQNALSSGRARSSVTRPPPDGTRPSVVFNGRS